MDLTDRKILACLKENARQNATEIGAKINLSTSAVIERIRKMENSGYIEQYTVLLNRNLLGKDLMAFVYVRLEHPKFYENFVDVIKAHNEVSECYYIAGDFDFILKVVADKTKGLEKVLNDIKSINGVSLTRTSVVLSTDKCDDCLLPDDNGIN